MSQARLVFMLAAITTTSGLILGGVNELTHETIENNNLKFKKIPAVADIWESVNGPSATPKAREALEAQLLADKRALPTDDGDLVYFVITKDGAPYAVTLEDAGKGFGGDLGVITGFLFGSGEIAGIGITTLAETPGVGTHVRDASFRKQFKGMPADAVTKITKDGGDIDGITGATISSRAVSAAITQARVTFDTHREALQAAAAEASP